MTARHCTQCGAVLESQARFCHGCGTQVQTARVKKPSRRRGRGVRKAQPISLLLLAAGGVLLLAGALFYLLDRPAPAADTPDNVASIPDNHDESGLPYPEVVRISLTQAKASFDKGTVVLVDVRTREEYAKAHIPDAISVPLNELETRYAELSKGDEIITYCS